MLAAAGVKVEMQQRVLALSMATGHDAVPVDGDAQLPSVSRMLAMQRINVPCRRGVSGIMCTRRWRIGLSVRLPPFLQAVPILKPASTSIFRLMGRYRDDRLLCHTES